MAPYSEHQTGSVELYEVAGVNYLRVQYRVFVYDLLPRSYMSDEWIMVGTSPSGTHQLSGCPPPLRKMYDSAYAMTGTIDVGTSEVRIDLKYGYPDSKGSRKPYQTNGTWAFVNMKGQTPDPNARRTDCS